MPIRADRRIWLNADKTKIVEEGSDEAAHLLAGPGDLITSDWVERLGLELKDESSAVASMEPEVNAPAAEE